MTNFENDIACPEPNEKKSGSRKNYLCNVFLEKKEHSRHLVVWLYLKPQMALVFSYNHSTAGVLFFQYET